MVSNVSCGGSDDMSVISPFCRKRQRGMPRSTTTSTNTSTTTLILATALAAICVTSTTAFVPPVSPLPLSLTGWKSFPSRTATTTTTTTTNGPMSRPVSTGLGQVKVRDETPGGSGKLKSSYSSSTTTSTTTSKKTNMSNNNKKKKTDSNVAEVGDGEDSGWLYWMTKGRKRGVSEVKLREAEELGGVARNDRYSSSDWLHNTASLPSSAILKAIRGPVMFMTSWATFLSVVYMRLQRINPASAALLTITLGPHQLMVSALSLLLVFKTNSAYQRFAEGRKIWEGIINNSRDLYRMLYLYENEMGRSKRRRLQRLLAAFPYLLRHRIRPNLVMYRLDDVANARDPGHSIVLYQDKAADDLDPEAAKVATQEENEGKSRRKTRPLFWVDKRTLPWRLLPPNALEPCARAQNRPLWVCDRMAQELRNIPESQYFSARERLALIAKVEKLSGCIGACERIHQTAVPLNYARHSLRALTLWLFTLPFALVSSLRLITGPVLFLVSWLLFGVYEIGYSIEDPFQGTLRLSVLCDTVRRDVLADEVTRSSAFEIDERKDPEKPTLGDTATNAAAAAAAASTATTSSSSGTSSVNIQKKEGDDEYDDDEDHQIQPDYASSSVIRPQEDKPVPKEEGEGQEYVEQEYELSPVHREKSNDAAKKDNSSNKKTKKKIKPVEVEELPSIPIPRNVNGDVLSSSKKP